MQLLSKETSSTLLRVMLCYKFTVYLFNVQQISSLPAINIHRSSHPRSSHPRSSRPRRRLKSSVPMHILNHQELESEQVNFYKPYLLPVLHACYIVLHANVMLCYIVLHANVMLCYMPVMLCYMPMLCCVTRLCYVVLHTYVMLCYLPVLCCAVCQVIYVDYHAMCVAKCLVMLLHEQSIMPSNFANLFAGVYCIVAVIRASNFYLQVDSLDSHVVPGKLLVMSILAGSSSMHVIMCKDTREKSMAS